MHQCIELFYLGMTLYMFQTVFPSIIRSSRLYIQLSNRYCSLLASKQTTVSVWQMPVAVCTVLNSWWWTERPSETCTASFQNKIIWYICTSSWFYYRNILRCTALWTSNTFVSTFKFKFFFLNVEWMMNGFLYYGIPHLCLNPYRTNVENRVSS